MKKLLALLIALAIPTTTWAVSVPWNKDVNGKIYPPFVTDYVGIGTTNPNGILHVNSGTDSVLRVQKSGTVATGDISGIMFKITTDTSDNFYYSGIFGERQSDGSQKLHLGVMAPDTDNVDVTDARLTINSLGNVGIGTTSPTQKLTVYGTTKIESSGETITLPTSAASDLSPNSGLYLGYDNTNLKSFIRAVKWGTGFSPLYLQGSEFRFSTGVGTLTERMVIDSTGNVGIGTTSPYARLSVNGSIVTDSIFATSTTATSTFSGGLSAGSNGLTVLQNGNVGIGTTSPSTALTVSGSGYVTDHIGINTATALGSDGFAENSVFSINAPTVGGTFRERLIYAKVADSNNYFSVINTTGSPGVFAPTFVGYAPDSPTVFSAVYFDGRIPIANDTGVVPVITFRAQQLDGSNILSTRPIVGFGSGGGGNTIRTAIWTSGGFSHGASFVASDPGINKAIFQDNLGIGTTSPYEKLSVVGRVVAQSFFATSTTATSTFQDVTVQGKPITGFRYMRFGYATTTTWTGTTTPQPIGLAGLPQTYDQLTCATNGGTVNVQITNNSGNLTMVPASSTAATYTLSTNNALGYFASSSIVYGTPASSPTTVNCVLRYYLNNDQ